MRWRRLLALALAAAWIAIAWWQTHKALPAGTHVASLTHALLAQRRALPDLKVLFVIDPANEAYGAMRLPELELLRAAGVEVVPVDLDALRDSNPLYSSLWRLALRWWDAPRAPFGVESRRLNFKADERKLVIADDGRDALVAVVASANPLDRESRWSNSGIRVSGAARVPRSRCSSTSTRYGTTARRSASSTPRISRFSPILRSRTTGSPG